MARVQEGIRETLTSISPEVYLAYIALPFQTRQDFTNAVTDAQQLDLQIQDSEITYSRAIALVSALWTIFDLLPVRFHHKYDSLIGDLIADGFSSLAAEVEWIPSRLSFFQPALSRIVYDCFRTFGGTPALGTRILEQCLAQASHEAGALHIDRYYASDRTQPRAARSNTEQRRVEIIAGNRWRQFLSTTLQHRADRPTLFETYYYIDDPYEITTPPRLLYRVYDRTSSGISNASFICSSLDDHIDLLSLDMHTAAGNLAYHLDKGLFRREEDRHDRLISWTSSLLVALYYALFRKRLGGVEVSICVVDSSLFPPGTFANAIELMRHYQRYDDRIPGLLKHVHNGHDTAEYLTQGWVSLEGRSSTVSLQRLLDAGLYNLCPELRKWQHKWIARSTFLRGMWRKKVHTTTFEEIQTAWHIATVCCDFRKHEFLVALLAIRGQITTEGIHRDQRPCSADVGTKGHAQHDTIHAGLDPTEVQCFTSLYKSVMDVMEQIRGHSDDEFLAALCSVVKIG